MDLPEQDELVIAIIKKILPYGAFCSLPEYNIEAFLHVSEVAPRWIKNIHEFISEGQRLVVKVYHLDKQKNQVDVSLKRVSEEEKRKKQEQVSLDKRAEKLLEVAISESKAKLDYETVKKTIIDHFGDLFSCFQSAFDDEKNFGDLDVPQSLKSAITEVAKKNIKKAVIEISGIASITCYDGDGVNKIKNMLDLSKEVSVTYLGAPRYKFSVTSDNYKSAEKSLASAVEHIKGFADKNNCDFNFERSE